MSEKINIAIVQTSIKWEDIQVNLSKYEQIIDSMNPGTGKSEFIAASIYIKQNDISKICQYANLAAEMDYPGSYGIISQFCRN